MKYDIVHELRLTYSAPVWEHHVEMRLTPQESSHQQVRAAQIEIDPACQPRSYRDCFGNRVHYCSLVTPHDHLTVRMRAQVETALDNPFDYTPVAPARESAWVAESLRAQPRLWDYVLHRSAATPDLAALAGAAQGLLARKADHAILDAVMAGLDWIGEVVAYEPAFTHAPAKLADVLSRGSGGCQDFAHLLISIVRAWGFPARYVMGYQDPGYAEDDAVDAAQRAHAWAEVLVPGAGWRGIDPTTRLIANQTYIAVAVGRDASDAAPIRAVFKGGGNELEAGGEAAVTLEVTRDQ